MTHEEIFRQQMIEALRHELIGPPWLTTGTGGDVGNGIVEQPGEVLQESPVQRYSAGVLFPPSQPIIEVEGFSCSFLILFVSRKNGLQLILFPTE